MLNMIQDLLLNQVIILIVLMIVLLIITRWAVLVNKQYAGYALGWLLGLFFLLVYASLFADRVREPVSEGPNLFQVFLATFFGLVGGAAVQYALRFWMGSRRGLALQAAIYTAINLILLFLVIIESETTQRMVGIFGLALGIATLLGVVLFPVEDHPAPAYGAQAQGMPQGSQQPSRLDNIRRQMKDRNQR